MLLMPPPPHFNNVVSQTSWVSQTVTHNTSINSYYHSSVTNVTFYCRVNPLRFKYVFYKLFQYFGRENSATASGFYKMQSKRNATGKVQHQCLDKKNSIWVLIICNNKGHNRWSRMEPRRMEFKTPLTLCGTTIQNKAAMATLGHKQRALFQKMIPLASKLLVLEPKQISDPELEN